MLIEEKFIIKSPLKESWAFLLNPETIGPCFPGCQNVDVISDTEYHSGIAAKVGPISVRFNVKTVIDETRPPNFIHTVGEGKEIRKMGSFKQKTAIHLTEISKDETEIAYRSEVSVVGRLATFGDRVLKSKAAEIGKEFADQVNRGLTGEVVENLPFAAENASLITRIAMFFKNIFGSSSDKSRN
jgi:hypothetical protein